MPVQESGSTIRYVATDFRISCRGLKARTIHRLYYSERDISEFCRPDGGNMGDQLITDANGAIDFTFHFDGNALSLSLILSVAEVQTYIQNLLSGAPRPSNQPTPNPVMLLRNDLGDSFCSATIGINEIRGSASYGSTAVIEPNPLVAHIQGIGMTTLNLNSPTTPSAAASYTPPDYINGA